MWHAVIGLDRDVANLLLHRFIGRVVADLAEPGNGDEGRAGDPVRRPGPFLPRHQLDEPKDVVLVVATGLIDEPVDQALIKRFNRKAVLNRFRQEAAQADLFNPRQPARYLVLPVTGRRSEKIQARDTIGVTHRHQPTEISPRRSADEMRFFADNLVKKFKNVIDQPRHRQR